MTDTRFRNVTLTLAPSIIQHANRLRDAFNAAQVLDNHLKGRPWTTEAIIMFWMALGMEDCHDDPPATLDRLFAQWGEPPLPKEDAPDA